MFMTIRPLLAALLCCVGLAVSPATRAQSAQSATTPRVVSLEAARDALDTSSAIVIDIREPSEHATGVAKGAKLIPMGQLPQRIKEVVQAPDQAVLLICNTQNRSARGADQLRAAGYTNISYVHGGMGQWAARNWPMVKP
jgi:rhodanese-related sulfurtransferase